MSFDPATLLLSLVIGGIGFVLFVYGKKQARWPQLVAGLLFMIYPYFVDGVLAMIAIAAVIGGGLWYAVQLGW